MSDLKGTWVPKHVRIELTPERAAALQSVLKDARDDDGFVLNEMEQEVVDGLLEVLEDDGESAYTR